ncbi:phospholipid-transporting ATPase ABCA3-like [Sycon ciliatum]|uniref:phospholipid-transporting ATPase ABCA3-like n=1 Tax=Sycon ciliatum TaxID=27933 RepID=UPI0031F6AFA9
MASSSSSLGQILWQFRLLMWKHFVIQKRLKGKNIALIFLPIVAPVFFAIFRLPLPIADLCFQSCPDASAPQRVNFTNTQHVAFYPDSPLTRRIMSTVRCLSTGLTLNYSSDGSLTGFPGEPIYTEGFNDTRLMVELVTNNETNYIGAVVFDGIDENTAELSPVIKYTIRLHDKESTNKRGGRYSWYTDRTYPVVQLSGIFRFINYEKTFVPLQYIVDQAVIRLQVEGNATCPMAATCPDSQAQAAVTTCSIVGRAESGNATGTCLFNETSQTFVRCQNVSVSTVNCNCSRQFTRNTPSQYGLYTANCSCDNSADATMTFNSTCRSIAKSTTSCCGRCPGSAQQPTFLPAIFKTFPFPSYSFDTLLILYSNLYGFVLLFCTFAVVNATVLEVVTEKATRLRESMRMMGLRIWLYWLTHFLKAFLVLLPSAIVGEIVLRQVLFPDTGAGIVFLWYILFNIQLICYCIFLSSLIDSPKSVSTWVGILWYFTYIPFSIAGPNFAGLSRGIKILICLFPTSNAAVFAQFTGNKKTNGEALTGAAMSQPTSIDDDFRYNDILLGEFISILLCLLLVWYKENAFPGEYGIPKVWYFPFTRSYWFGAPPPGDEEEMLLADTDPDKNETDPKGLKAGISIRTLHKIFKTNDGHKLAVDNLSLNMYMDQITVLLGHNGAGKTTTMSMLVGLFPPTRGDAIVGGHSVVTDIEGVRRSIGLCPQHNVLVDLMSVQEHLVFFLQLRQGHGGGEKHVSEIIKDLQLVDKSKWKSSELSGGMKRKLSVGIALIGHPSVVILDEPTAGMDPYARRATWDLLGKYKRGTTMLLTTHLMDEADLLGDRIAIMSKGRVVCSGSSLFLKSKFGVGYHMVLVKDHERECDEVAVTSKVTSAVPGSRLVGNAGAELAYVLPQEASSHFSALFTSLEENRTELGILSYGVSVTKLEEVFLKVGEEEGIVANKKLQKFEERQAAAGPDSTATLLLEHQKLGNVDSTATTATIDQGSPTAKESGLVADGLTEIDENGTANNGTQSAAKEISAPPANSGSAKGAGGARKSVVIEREARPLEMLRADYQKLTGRALWQHQYKAMVIKRMLNAKRNYFYNALTLLVPVILTCFSFGSLIASPSTSADPRLVFNYTELKPVGTLVADYRNASERAQMPILSSLASRDYLTRTLDSKITDYSSSSLLLRGGERQCCAARTFLLNNTCVKKRYAEGEDAFKSCPNSFGFSRCSQCLRNKEVNFGRFTGACGFGCPAIPLLTTSKRDSILFQKRVLQDADVGLYYIENPAGVTLHSVATNPDDLPDNKEGETYVRMNVSCSDPNVEVSDSNCSDFRPNRAFFTDNSDAEGINTYARVWSSAKSYHGQPIAMNVFSNMHLKAMMDLKSAAYREYFIETANEPLPPPISRQVAQAGNSIGAFVFASLVAFGMAFLSASFVVSPVEEVSNKARHIQRLCGVKGTVYWLAHFSWDIVFFILPALVLVVVFAAFNVDAYQGEALGAVFVLLLLFGLCSIPLAYWISFAFSQASKAYKNTAFLFSGIPLLCLIVDFALKFPGVDLNSVADSLRYIFFAIPHFSFAYGITSLYTINERKKICKKFPVVATGRGLSRDDCYTQFNIITNLYDTTQPGLGVECLYMFFMTFFYAGMVYLAEMGFFRMLQQKVIKKIKGDSDNDEFLARTADDKEDDDVARERRNVIENLNDVIKKEAVVLHNLTKVYNSFLGRPAADNLCLTIPQGECFGLCGVNGAGKTTTFNMMTGDTPSTSGTVYLQGYDISTHLREVQRNIGYCPQFDALLERLTSRELLALYCRLRGIPEEYIVPTVESIISEMHLTDWADKTCGTYSGGNKRKLSVAVALVGNPPILFLDEPTAGMDPGARRFLWDVLTDVLASGRSIVLTSHSMEECEALCTRLAIMVNGRFKCLGSIQHLKTKFGSGYSMSLKVGHKLKKATTPAVAADATNAETELSVYTGAEDEADKPAVVAAADVDDDDDDDDDTGLAMDEQTGAPSTDAAEKFIKETFPGADLLEARQGQLHYNINIPDLTWSTIFREIEGQRKKLSIVDYSVTQATLEEVFVNFASAQFGSDDDNDKKSKKKKKKKKNDQK